MKGKIRATFLSGKIFVPFKIQYKIRGKNLSKNSRTQVYRHKHKRIRHQLPNCPPIFSTRPRRNWSSIRPCSSGVGQPYPCFDTWLGPFHGPRDCAITLPGQSEPWRDKWEEYWFEAGERKGRQPSNSSTEWRAGEEKLSRRDLHWDGTERERERNKLAARRRSEFQLGDFFLRQKKEMEIKIKRERRVPSLKGGLFC